MIADLLRQLLEANIAAAAVIAVVLMARKPVARLLGPGAAYLLWAIVPVAMLATFIPARTVFVEAAPSIDITGLSASATATLEGAPTAIFDWLPAAFVVWVAGMLAMVAMLTRKQAQFMADVERGEAGPAVVGFFRPHLVTPDDFAQRFNVLEQRLVLAHEQVHLERQDTRINAVVALARCLCWFNPLMHVGAHAFRVDQEVSCDAVVVERRPRTRRLYAETLLKTELAARPLPVGCYWPPSLESGDSQHPLTERIAMLTRHPLSARRRLLASGAIAVVAAGAGMAAWAAQPVREIAASPAELLFGFDSDGEEQTIFIMSPEGDGLSGPEAAPDEPQPTPVISASAATKRPFPGPDFVAPAYPQKSIELREEGDVVAELCVAQTGRIESVKLIKSSGHPRLDDATRQGLLATQLQPALLDGKPVSVCEYQLAYVWSIPEQAAGQGSAPTKP